MERRAFLATIVAAPFAGVGNAAPSPQIAKLAARVAQRYRVAPVAAALVLDTSRDVFPEDPALLVALAGVESRMQPFAVGKRGEVGLVQIRPELYALEPASLIDPRVNLAAGARILRQCIRAGGDIRRGLARYNGTGEAAERYAARVLAERRRLSSVS